MFQKKAFLTKAGMFVIMLFFIMLLTACGETTCDFCGESKVCEEFDIMGTTRHICRDCLENSAGAVSQNVARQYAALYEDGTLEYPEGSPLKPVDKNAKNEPGPSGYSKEAPSAPLSAATGASTAKTDKNGNKEERHEKPAPEAASQTTPAPSVTGSSTPQVKENISDEKKPDTDTPAENGNTASERRISSLSATLQADGLSLAATDSAETYKLMNGNTDTKITFTLVGDRLRIEEYDPSFSQEYVKSVIRSILSYTGSSDYDGFGHDVYNSTIENGSFVSGDINFVSKIGTAEEIEKGYPATSFAIVP
ncbi:MAG: hypothetical protein K5987_04805 [Lachnospiraceae bacterium]|nr:hypothetical protein [Lachnospiraceae bacterium]